MPQPPVSPTRPDIDSYTILEKGTQLRIYDPKREFEHSGYVESVGSMAERHDIHIKLSDGTTIILMVRRPGR